MTSLIKSIAKFSGPRALRTDAYPMISTGNDYPRSGDPRIDLANFERRPAAIS